MSPRHILATAVIGAVAAGGLTAAVVADDHDKPARPVVITSTADLRPVVVDDVSLDDILAKGSKVTFDLRGTSSSLRGRIARDTDGLVTGRIEARP